MSASLIGLKRDCALLRIDISDWNEYPSRIQRKVMRIAIKQEKERRATERAQTLEILMRQHPLSGEQIRAYQPLDAAEITGLMP